MRRIQKVGLTLAALFSVGLFLHELRHFYRYGHLAPFGLHADVSITTSGDVLGVAQVSRKGLDATLAGADFTNDDLKQLEEAAEILSRMAFMQEGAEF